jgi:hypothetical protein
MTDMKGLELTAPTKEKLSSCSLLRVDLHRLQHLGGAVERVGARVPYTVDHLSGFKDTEDQHFHSTSRQGTKVTAHTCFS